MTRVRQISDAAELRGLTKVIKTAKSADDVRRHLG
jgi:hypothetical protein